jgi:transposase-like protein
MNTTCPQCGLENAHFDIMDEEGAHYTCPDCDHEWVDEDVEIEKTDEEE